MTTKIICDMCHSEIYVMNDNYVEMAAFKEWGYKDVCKKCRGQIRKAVNKVLKERREEE